LSPVRFNILLEVVIPLALENNKIGATVSGNLISNLRFADDICLVATSNDDLQQLVDAVHMISSRFGLTVSSSKTVVQTTGTDEQQMKIMLGNCQLEQCQEFVYLGGNITQNATYKDVDRRIGLAAGILRSLHHIWKAEDISKPTKVLLYKTLVQSLILHNSETWTFKKNTQKEVFEMSVLRKMSGINKMEKEMCTD